MIDSLINIAIRAAIEAGTAIMDVYATDFAIELKSDKSPLTLADQRAHSIIAEYLEKTNLPILSEEGADIPFHERKDWISFWLVDPLDGTKEFINRNGDFTVNIALIEDSRSIAGVVYAPVPDLLYFALPLYGAFRVDGSYLKQEPFPSFSDILENSSRLPVMLNSEDYVIVASRSHQNEETSNLIQQISASRGKVTFLSKGSSLKFCAVAEGSADYYPRLGPTMEWDTAAGHAIALHAKCQVFNPETSEAIIYNKESLLNPFFIVERQ
ncbi:MAG: 3'(2'),5'-bisphosphate nucleotidase CysQ [Bacteroidetes bacterium]|nr:3'(2'),5'-bisphosphate nucleotidase CysQ [Bacteroidota bacterium]